MLAVVVVVGLLSAVAAVVLVARHRDAQHASGSTVDHRTLAGSDDVGDPTPTTVAPPLALASGLQRLTDPQGRFTLDVPSTWRSVDPSIVTANAASVLSQLNAGLYSEFAQDARSVAVVTVSPQRGTPGLVDDALVVVEPTDVLPTVDEWRSLLGDFVSPAGGQVLAAGPVRVAGVDGVSGDVSIPLHLPNGRTLTADERLIGFEALGRSYVLGFATATGDLSFADPIMTTFHPQ